jgi:hypothetical protein
MSKPVGTLDYRLDQYWVVGMSGQTDYALQAGDNIDVWTGTSWSSIHIGSYSDTWRRLWKFQKRDGALIVPRLGMKVQL